MGDMDALQPPMEGTSKRKAVTFAPSPAHPDFSKVTLRSKKVKHTMNIEFDPVLEPLNPESSKGPTYDQIRFVTQFNVNKGRDATPEVYRYSTRVNYLSRKSVSAVDLRRPILSKFNMEAFMVHEEKVMVIAQSMADLRAEEQCEANQFNMETSIKRYLKLNKFDGNYQFNLLSCGDDFFKIFTFMCNLPQAERFEIFKNVTTWNENINNMSVRSKLELRNNLIDFAIRIDRNCLKSEKKGLRNSDLLNPLAICSRPRVIHFLYKLLRFIQDTSLSTKRAPAPSK